MVYAFLCRGFAPFYEQRLINIFLFVILKNMPSKKIIVTVVSQINGEPPDKGGFKVDFGNVDIKFPLNKEDVQKILTGVELRITLIPYQAESNSTKNERRLVTKNFKFVDLGQVISSMEMKKPIDRNEFKEQLIKIAMLVLHYVKWNKEKRERSTEIVL